MVLYSKSMSTALPLGVPTVNPIIWSPATWAAAAGDVIAHVGVLSTSRLATVQNDDLRSPCGIGSPPAVSISVNVTRNVTGSNIVGMSASESHRQVCAPAVSRPVGLPDTVPFGGVPAAGKKGPPRLNSKTACILFAPAALKPTR